TEPEAKLHGLRVITEHLSPGSWDYAREPDKKELAAVSVLALPLTEASVKIRATYTGDDREDIEANTVWAGVLPLVTTYGDPNPYPDLTSDLPVPQHVADRRCPTDPRLDASARAT